VRSQSHSALVVGPLCLVVLFSFSISSVQSREQDQSAISLPVSDRSTNTAELSCWKDAGHVISRLGHSPVISSRTGSRAYAEVRATALRPRDEHGYTGLLCINTVKVFVAKPPVSGFHVVLDSALPRSDCAVVEASDSCEVNGIQLVDWSEDGRFLLADLVLWEYESDALLMRVPIIYDAAKGEFVRPDVYHFFDEYYKTDFYKEKPDSSTTHCEFELHSEGFSLDGNIVLSASRTPDNPSYDQVFCVDHKQTFLFDFGRNTIKIGPSNYKPQHYGTWSSGNVLKP
jgi:hypothetical protein